MADPIVNFFSSTLVGTYSDTDTSLTIATGSGDLLPDPSVDNEFNLVIYNESAIGVVTTYDGGSTDTRQDLAGTNPEIVRVTARSGDVLTVTRGQEGTTASVKEAGNTYRVILSATKKIFDDINSAIENINLTTISNVESITYDNTGDEVFQFPAGTTAQRPSSPALGYLRYNTDLNRVEYYNGSRWAGFTEIGFESLELGVATATISAQDAEAVFGVFFGQFGTPEAGYSVRQLGSNSLAMRVRRSSDNAETNIGFTADGDLDESALTTFTGANDGFVTTWYNQAVDTETLPADFGSGATASYSLRKVESGYTGNAIRVRRASDNTEQDIGFDSNGELDTSALDTFVYGTTALPADQGSGATASYSLRKVASSYTGSAIRVRRSSDNTEQDIGFVSGELDTGSLETFVGTDVNLVPYSEQFDQWGILSANNGTQITANTDVAPDGSTTADTVTDPETNTFTGVSQDFNVSTAGTHTVGVYVKKKASSPNDMMFRVTRSGIEHNIIFDASSGDAVDREGNISQINVTSVDANWWLLEMEVSLTAVSHQIQIYPTIATTTNTSFSMSMTGSVVLWGCHAYPGTSGSYVETGANPVGDAFVTTWYDQSGSNNATQSTADSQPKIVSSGSVIKENGKPAISFDNSGDPSLLATGLNVTQPTSYFIVGQNTNSTAGYLIDGVEDAQISRNIIGESGGNGVGLYAGSWLRGNTSDITTQSTISALFDGSSSTLHVNGVQTESGNAGTSGLNDLKISATTHEGEIQEIIVYNTDQSANREDIEHNQALYYDIAIDGKEAFVTTWYDQSGSNNATQSTAGSQPKIYDGTTIKENGKPAIDLDGSDDYLEIPSSNATFNFLHNGTSSFVSAVNTFSESGNDDGINRILGNFDGNAGQTGFLLQCDDRSGASLTDAFRCGIGNGSGSVYPIFMSNNNVYTPSNNQYITSVRVDADNATNTQRIIGNANGGSDLNSITASGGTATTNNASANMNFGRNHNGASYLSGSLQEIVIYNTDQSSNRELIEANQASFYNIGISGSHAVQGTAGSQPKIVSGGSVIKENSQPAISVTAGNYLDIASLTLGNSASIFAVIKNADQTGGGSIHRPFFAGADSDPYVVSSTSYGMGLRRDGSDAVTFLNPSTSGAEESLVISLATDNTMILVSGIGTGGTANLYVDGGSNVNSSFTQRTTGFQSSYSIFRDVSDASRLYQGSGSEIIIYTTDKTSDRTNIESDIATYFNITI